jgi:hypothetical protein
MDWRRPILLLLLILLGILFLIFLFILLLLAHVLHAQRKSPVFRYTSGKPCRAAPLPDGCSRSTYSWRK